MFLLIPSTLLARYTVVRTGAAVNLIISNGVAVLAVLMLTSNSFTHTSFCLMQRVIQLPCPGCGVTTGLGEVFRLNFSNAFRSNPCSLLIGAGMLLSLVLAVVHACSGKRPSEEALVKLVRKGNIILAGALILNYFFTLIKIHHLWQ